MFEDLVKHITTQRSEADNIRRQLAAANKTIQLQNASIPLKIQEALDEERRQLAEDRSKLTTFLEAQREAQEARMAERAAQVQASVTGTGTALEASMAQYGTDMDAWDGREAALLDEVKRSRDQLKTRLKDDWNAANERSTAIDAAANNVHAEAARVAGEQVDGLDARMEALDDLVARAKADNAAHVEQHARAVMAVSNTVETSLASVGGHFKTSCDRVANLGDEMDLDVADLRDGLDPLDAQVVQPLANLREHVAGSSLHEYQPTGETPQKVVYQYPTQLPRTDTSTPVAKRVRRSEDATEPTQEQQTEQETEEVEEQQPVDIPSDSDAVEADSNTVVFADDAAQGSSPARTSTGNNTSLREVNPNLAPAVEASVVPAAPGDGGSLLKTAGNHRVHSGIAKRVTGEGRENVPLAAGFARGELKRKSPRLN